MSNKNKVPKLHTLRLASMFMGGNYYQTEYGAFCDREGSPIYQPSKSRKIKNKIKNKRRKKQ